MTVRSRHLSKKKGRNVLLCWFNFTIQFNMVQPTIKKHQRPAALKIRIEKMKAQLKELEDLLAAAPEEQLPATRPPDGEETQGAHLPATPPPPPSPAMPA